MTGVDLGLVALVAGIAFSAGVLLGFESGLRYGRPRERRLKLPRVRRTRVQPPAARRQKGQGV